MSQAMRTARQFTLAALVATSACGDPPGSVPAPRDGLIEASLGVHPASTAGAQAWDRHCRICHGATGAGDGFNAKLLPVPPPTAAALAARLAGDTLADAIARGSQAGGRGPWCPAWRRVLGATGSEDIAAFVRALASSPAAPVPDPRP